MTHFSFFSRTPRARRPPPTPRMRYHCLRPRPGKRYLHGLQTSKLNSLSQTMRLGQSINVFFFLLSCNHCSNWTWVVEEILAFGNRQQFGEWYLAMVLVYAFIVPVMWIRFLAKIRIKCFVPQTKGDFKTFY